MNSFTDVMSVYRHTKNIRSKLKLEPRYRRLLYPNPLYTKYEVLYCFNCGFDVETAYIYIPGVSMSNNWGYVCENCINDLSSGSTRAGLFFQHSHQDKRKVTIEKIIVEKKKKEKYVKLTLEEQLKIWEDKYYNIH